MVAGVPDSRKRVWDQLNGQDGVLRGLDVHESPVFASQAMTFGRFNAFVGLHGSGKSYLLSMLGSALPWWQTRTNLPIDSRHHQNQLRGRYTMTLSLDGGFKELAVDRPMPWSHEWEQGLRPLVATMLTPFMALSDLEYVADNYYSPKGPPEPVALTRLSRRELESVRAITGHEYDWLEYGRIETEDSYFPYVRGVRGSRQVDSWSMSTSEFWVHYVLWCLHTADENEVVLIDEPESFLAQSVHQSFVDEIARLTLKSQCQTFLATHSEDMIRRIPRECVLLVTSGESGASVSGLSDLDIVLRTVSRYRPPISVLAFVEDDLAVRMLKAILRQFARAGAENFDIIDSGGKDEVLAGLRVVRRSRRIKTVGILDGDQRGSTPATDIFFLPGDTSPEAQLLIALRSDLKRGASELGVEISELRLALESARFCSHQRVFEEISQSLGSRSGEEISELAIAIWLEQADTASAARELAERLSRC